VWGEKKSQNKRRQVRERNDIIWKQLNQLGHERQRKTRGEKIIKFGFEIKREEDVEDVITVRQGGQ
jgi:hypothetical protein